MDLNSYYADASISYLNELAYIIERIPTFLFVGQNDANVNYQGQMSMVNAMNWKGTVGFKTAIRYPFKMNGEVKALIKCYDNLSFALVFKCGHEVAMRQKAVAKELARKFINGMKLV